MQKTKKLISKPRQYDGMQFDGTDKSAQDIIDWVLSFNGNAWWGKGFLMVNTDSALSEIKPSFWIVRDEEVEFRVYTDKEASERFDEVDDEE